MKDSVRFVYDAEGRKTSVLVPYKEWERTKIRYEKLRRKFEVFRSIADGMREVKEAKKKGKSLQSLSEILNER